MNNIYLPIGKLFSIEKGDLQSTKAIKGDFKFLTAAEETKTHNTYKFECEALIFACAASGSLGRTHYINDKFTASDLCFVLTPKDPEKLPINLKFYHFVFNSIRMDLVKKTKGGTSKESINQTNFKNYQIPYFDIKKQNYWIEKLKNTLEIKEQLCNEFRLQSKLLERIKQQILQDAIEGKASKNWRDHNLNIETSDQLLNKINIEKTQLLNSKLLKQGTKQKSNIQTIEKINFPESWKIVDLDDITQFITDGTHQTPNYTDSGRIFLSARNVKPFKFMPNIHRYISEEDFKMYVKNKIPTKGDILVGRVGSKGEAAVIDQDIEFAFYVSLCLVKTFKNYTSPEFIEIVMNSPYGNAYASGNMSSLGTSAGNFNLGRIRTFPIPFPPLEEQKFIVTLVGKLSAICTKIEDIIKFNELQAEHIMHSILKNAFNLTTR